MWSKHGIQLVKLKLNKSLSFVSYESFSKDFFNFFCYISSVYVVGPTPKRGNKGLYAFINLRSFGFVEFSRLCSNRVDKQTLSDISIFSKWTNLILSCLQWDSMKINFISAKTQFARVATLWNVWSFKVMVFQSSCFCSPRVFYCFGNLVINNCWIGLGNNSKVRNILP